MHMPIAAKSDDREIKPQSHPSSGNPEEWFSNCAVSFDFFINWSINDLQNEIWIKILLDTEDIAPDDAPINDLLVAIKKCYASFDVIEKFVNSCNIIVPFEIHYMLFWDSQDWTDNKSVIYDLSKICGEWNCKKVMLEKIKCRIKNLSGGAASIGSKGMKFTTSNLESSLSKTDSLWPGDVDAIILHKVDGHPLAILEYRKHNKDSNVTTVKPYYDNGADKKKYDRLSILAQRLNVPLVVLTYPTNPKIKEILMELVTVNEGIMNVKKNCLCAVPSDKENTKELKEALNNLIS